MSPVTSTDSDSDLMNLFAISSGQNDVHPVTENEVATGIRRNPDQAGNGPDQNDARPASEVKAGIPHQAGGAEEAVQPLSGTDSTPPYYPPQQTGRGSKETSQGSKSWIPAALGSCLGCGSRE